MDVTPDQMAEVHRRVGRLEGLVEGMERRLDALHRRVEELAGDIRDLRRELRMVGLGLAALIGALGVWG